MLKDGVDVYMYASNISFGSIYNRLSYTFDTFHNASLSLGFILFLLDKVFCVH